MSILDRYLFKAIVGSTLLVLLVLLALGGFVEFVSQLNSIGEGNYDMAVAGQYVLLKLPRLAAGLLPVSALLGALLGLGVLASGSELIVLRAAGVSAGRLARSVGITGVLIALVGGVIGEFIAPQMDLLARQIRAVAKSGEIEMVGSSSWLRDGNVIFNVRSAMEGIEYGGVFSYRIKAPGKLAGIGRADPVDLDADSVLSDYRESRFDTSGVRIDTEISPSQASILRDLLTLTAVRDSNLTAPELYRYVRYLKANALESDRFEIIFWGRMAGIAGVALMCVLALPFVFGSLRTTGAGARMIVGVLIGVAYFLLNRTLADSGAVFNLHPLLVAWLPTGLLAAATLFGLSRMR